MEEEWEETTFLNPEKLKESAEKLKSGEITCNIDSPEDCEACGS